MIGCKVFVGCRRSNVWLAAAATLLFVVSFCRTYVNASFVFTSGGTFKLIFGYSIPIDLPTPMGINYVHNFQFQYPVVDNASQVAYVQQGARASSRFPRAPSSPPPSVTRKQIYSLIERTFDKRGVDTRGCLLRSICETGASPLAGGGLVGQLLQTLLTPYDPDDGSVYSGAWRSGRDGLDCFHLFRSCPYGHNFLDHVSYYM